mmetsp:Transcript_19343/g.44856  ORF Transcript_19343/g.44856 Transcript_19343/m.44856 type:complete len:261 (-) Transcript_19343:942-1724(-)
MNESTVVLLRTYLALYTPCRIAERPNKIYRCCKTVCSIDRWIYIELLVDKYVRGPWEYRVAVAVAVTLHRVVWNGLGSNREGRKDGWMDDEKDGTVNARDGWMDGWMDGPTDRPTTTKMAQHNTGLGVVTPRHGMALSVISRCVALRHVASRCVTSRHVTSRCVTIEIASTEKQSRCSTAWSESVRGIGLGDPPRFGSATISTISTSMISTSTTQQKALFPVAPRVAAAPGGAPHAWPFGVRLRTSFCGTCACWVVRVPL